MWDMKDYLEKRREELSKRDGGFTLMEMLIVVAIIAVLIAIAIPIFTSQLEKSREATDMANVRSAYATVSADYLTNADNDASMTVKANQTQSGWQTEGGGKLTTMVNGKESTISYDAKTSGSYTVKITKSGTVSVN